MHTEYPRGKREGIVRNAFLEIGLMRIYRIVAVLYICAVLGGVASASERALRRSAAIAPAAAQIVANAGTRGYKISPFLLGALSPQEDADMTSPLFVPAYASVPFALTPYADGYFHWQNDIGCSGPPDGPGQVNYLPASGDFDHFMTDLVIPDKMAAEIHVAIGTNPACNGRASPAEAAAWVKYANLVKHYDVKYWQIGYYPYDPDEPDFGPAPKIRDDPELYAAFVNSFGKAMQAVDPSVSVGVAIQPSPAGPPSAPSAWDAAVLSRVHAGYVVWPEPPLVPCCGGSSFSGLMSDHDLLYEAPLVVRAELAQARAELVKYKQIGTEIRPDVSAGTGEISQQNDSITTTLYLGMLLGEDVNAGASETWQDLLVGGCEGPFKWDTGEYGVQRFASSALISAGLPDPTCPSAPTVRAGTLFPPANAYKLAAAFAHGGEFALPVTVSAKQPDLRAYAATQGSGYAFMLFNLNDRSSITTTLGVANTKATAFSAVSHTYDTAIYDAVAKGGLLGPGLGQPRRGSQSAHDNAAALEHDRRRSHAAHLERS